MAQVWAAAELIKLSMFTSALKVVDSSPVLLTAVCREIQLVIRESAQKTVQEAVSSWTWDDIDIDLLIREWSPQCLIFLRSRASHPSNTLCVNDLHALLQEHHTVLIQECFP